MFVFGRHIQRILGLRLSQYFCVNINVTTIFLGLIYISVSLNLDLDSKNICWVGILCKSLCQTLEYHKYYHT